MDAARVDEVREDHPAGVGDARLAQAQQDVLAMVECAARIAEGLALNCSPSDEATAANAAIAACHAAPNAPGAPETVAADAAKFAQLADSVEETLRRTKWPEERPYVRTSDEILLRRHLDDEVKDAAEELSRSLQSDLESALKESAERTAARAAAGDDSSSDDDDLLVAEALDKARICAETAELAGFVLSGPPPVSSGLDLSPPAPPSAAFQASAPPR